MLRSSYTNHHRRMLPPLLAALSFRCDNTAYRPVMDTLARWPGTPRWTGKHRFYAAGERVQIEGVGPKAWLEAVDDGTGRIERIPYELCVLVALRKAIRRREVYVEGGIRWRNPEDHLPGDFDDTCEIHHAALRQPYDPTAFVSGAGR